MVPIPVRLNSLHSACTETNGLTWPASLTQGQQEDHIWLLISEHPHMAAPHPSHKIERKENSKTGNNQTERGVWGATLYHNALSCPSANVSPVGPVWR